MKSIFKFLIISSLIFTGRVNAQTPDDSTYYRPHGLNALVRVQDSKVFLRWAPSTFSLWEIGNTHGYVIERRAYSANPMVPDAGDIQGDESFIALPNMPIKPWTLEKFKAEVTDTSDRYAGVAMELLYGEVEGAPSIDKGTGLQDMMMDQQRRFAFALMSADFSAKAADGMALRYVDSDVKPGWFYEYRIRYNFVSKDLGTDTVIIYANMKEPHKAQAVTNCYTEAGDGAIKIVWLRNNNIHFTAYDVERSEDQKSWKRLNTQPFVSSSPNPEIPNVFIDTNTLNGKNYFYRLRGYTPFADKGDYSAVMKSSSKDMTPPAPPFNVQAKDDGGVVMITWEDMEQSADHDGYFVGRSYLASGGFEKISNKLPKDARAFVDFQADPLANNYYTVWAVDKSGNEAMSYVALGYIVDSMPPDMPTGLRGAIDSSGIVRLEWDRGPEADIIGYRVYWANDTFSEFSQLTGSLVPGLNYNDSVELRTLGEEVYYTIVAVDHRYNHSEMSKPVKLAKPDIVPPAAPVIKDYQAGQLSVEFNWIASISTDVVQNRLERKKDNGDWALLSSPSLTTRTWRDSGLIARSTYGYRICAVDDAGNVSCSEPLIITALDRGTRAGVRNLRVVKNQQNILLTWDYSSSGNFQFVIYQKTEEGQNLMPIARLAGTERTWQTAANPFEIGVRVVHSDGGESELVTTRP